MMTLALRSALRNRLTGLAYLEVHGTMLINDRELAVEVDGSGPPVVFLHGIGGTSNVFQIQAEILAADHQVIRTDFAGAGRSPVTGPISIETHAADITAVLDALGVPGPAVVVAHSMGTLVARTLAARSPGLVRGLALLAPVRAPGESGRHFQQERAALIRTGDLPAVAALILNGSVSRQTRAHKPEVAVLVRELVMRQDPEGYARNVEALGAAADPGPLPADIPVVIAAGDQDAMTTPEFCRELAGGQANVTVRYLAGAGHWLPIEDGPAVTALLQDFI
jgi:3-oxoadipate enol-lactonase